MRRLSLVLVLALVTAALPASARELEFEDLVASMEQRLGKTRLRIPFQGLAEGLAGTVALPFGASNLRVAVFEDVQAPDGVIRAPFEMTPAGWRVLLTVRERGSTVQMLSRDEGSEVRVWMAVVEPNQVSMFQVQMRPSDLMAFLARQASARNSK